MDFNVYNTLTHKKETFIPVEPGNVRLYTCGLTVYNYAHIGNLRTYIFEDILKRALSYSGYNVKHVMNVTDVGHLESDGDTGEDKMALGSVRENKNPIEIARFYEEAFIRDFKALNIQMPDILCRATEHIQDMIDLIKRLEEKGYTYMSNGNLYFDISKFKNYHKFANLNIEDMRAGTRIDVDVNKKNPFDFVLWFTNSKFKNHIMEWESPWGSGFPGWHIECSAMSLKYLGENIDIHCGGVDHIPVHHTNEIAQSESALGHKWVNYWMHGEFLVMDKGKMSKSSGDFITIQTLVDNGYSPLAYRYLCLQSRYRKQLVFSFDTLEEARGSFNKLKRRIQALKEVNRNIDGFAGTVLSSTKKIKHYKDKFTKEVSDDLNTPNALTVLWDVINASDISSDDKLHLIEDFDRVLGLDLLVFEKLNTEGVDEPKVNDLIEERNIAREAKDWKKADEIRDRLIHMNIEIFDSKEGTTWKIRS